jgi:hypothetical protein
MPIAPDNFMVLRAGKFDLTNGAGAPGVDRTFTSLKAAPFPSITIYFHGGLVGLVSGEAQATTLNESFSAKQSSPFFLIWETGLTEVIEQNLPAIFNEAIFQRILSRVTQFVKGKLDKSLLPEATRAVTPLPLVRQDQIQAELIAGQTNGVMFATTPIDKLPSSETLTPAERVQIEGEIQNDLQLQIQAQQIANSREAPTETAKGATVRGATVTLMDPDVLDDVAPAQPGAKGVLSIATLAAHIVKVVARIIERFAQHRDHGAYLTIVEEILREFYVGNAGKFVWDGIKNEVDQAFGAAADCGGVYLVNQLKSLWTGGVKPRITLVGHSAGSIYISRLLKELDAAMPADFKVDIVFIAPACTFAVFADALKQAAGRIAHLRIFGMGDPIEMKNAIAGPLYPASLLYFVSGVLEDEPDEPILGMQRFYTLPVYAVGFPDIAAVKAFGPLTLPLAFAWSDVTQGPGANCDMHSHGGWITAAPNALASVLTIVGPGGF